MISDKDLEKEQLKCRRWAKYDTQEWRITDAKYHLGNDWYDLAVWTDDDMWLLHYPSLSKREDWMWMIAKNIWREWLAYEEGMERGFAQAINSSKGEVMR